MVNGTGSSEFLRSLPSANVVMKCATAQERVRRYECSGVLIPLSMCPVMSLMRRWSAWSPTRPRRRQDVVEVCAHALLFWALGSVAGQPTA